MTRATFPDCLLHTLYFLIDPFASPTLAFPYFPINPITTLTSLRVFLSGDKLWWIPKVSYCMMDYDDALRSNGDQILLPYGSAGLKGLTITARIYRLLTDAVYVVII